MDNQALNKELDQVKSDLSDLREDMATLLQTMKASGVAQGQEYYDRAYDSARRTGEAIRDRAEDTYDAIGREVEQRPLTSVLAAFATGFAVGMILDRRR
ncbi:hypothetical protein Tel_04330 [Candidatus Tenderia electrophaga]|jgi:ElaB/YqjD/DUF883 family membrane-anchored ribosome-binding protein|uniref:DUF883 domain-containing protein n=1 Tax=Candidatus Tenderia electrophaga TaxID=1748243 RepID=A0A0S2TB96_9GAMM|nr:hypothetical protein Tel_04330 [Candidatus Tenderia electrophaga]